MNKILLICPYFGEFPPWMDEFRKQILRMKAMGYDFLIDTNLRKFKERVKRKLGVDAPITPGSTKVSDYRGLLGYLYSENLRNYDWYGTTDFDMVYGDVRKWFTDEKLANLDIWSNHGTYISGPWTLYRNIPKVTTLFKNCDYEKYLIQPETNGWIENEYSRLVEQSGLRYLYTDIQGDPYHPPFNLTLIDGKLYQDGVEIPMLHFRRSKRWPLPLTES